MMVDHRQDVIEFIEEMGCKCLMGEADLYRRGVS